MNKNEIIYANINLLVDKINIQISNLELNNKSYLYNYKLKDLTNLKLRECQRCGKQFVPVHPNRNQRFCNDDCRYGSTKSTRKYKVSNDVKFRKIDNLRKAIYERRYRAKIINKPIKHNDILDTILIDLKVLLKDRPYISTKEFNMRIDMLRKQYKQVVRSQ